MITSEDESELDELMKMFSDPRKPPMGIVEYIVLRLQPLILLAEDYMGVPPIPVLPPNPKQGAQNRRMPPLYQ